MLVDQSISWFENENTCKLYLPQIGLQCLRLSFHWKLFTVVNCEGLYARIELFYCSPYCSPYFDVISGVTAERRVIPNNGSMKCQML